MEARTKRLITGAYWGWLTSELLLSNPWILFGPKLAAAPPFDTSSGIHSILCHTGSFLVLGALLAWTWGEKKGWGILLWPLLAIGHGLFTEWLQRYIPGRWSDPEDMICNVSGVLLGFSLVRACYLPAVQAALRRSFSRTRVVSPFSST